MHLPSLMDEREDVPMVESYFLSSLSVTCEKNNDFGFFTESQKSNGYLPIDGHLREFSHIVEWIDVLESTDMILSGLSIRGSSSSQERRLCP